MNAEPPYTEETEWTSFDGRKTKLKDLDDVHLANILRWVSVYNYPFQLELVLLRIAGARGLHHEFLERAEIPWKDAEGHWCLDCKRLS